MPLVPRTADARTLHAATDAARDEDTGRDAVLRQLKSLTTRNVLSIAVTCRDGSVSVFSPPFIVGGELIQFCRNDARSTALVNVRIDQIASIRERWNAAAEAAAED